MSAQSKTNHFDAIYPYLPASLQSKINRIVLEDDGNKDTLNDLIAFCYTGPSKGSDASSLEGFRGTKRALENGADPLATSLSSQLDLSSGAAKKPRLDALGPDASSLSAEDDPLYTIYTISVTSPVRKKVNVTIHQETIRFTNPGTDALEALIPLSSLSRAFLLDTAGKSKPYNTLIILPKPSLSPSSDPKDKDKDPPQIILGIDSQTPTPLRTRSFPSPPISHAKATHTTPLLLDFLSHLPPSVPLSQPSPSIFRNSEGKAYIDAYLRAKDGHLYFFEEGILFGEKKPIEWVRMEEISSVRTQTATGRTFTLIIRIKDEEEEGEGGEDEAMIGAEEDGAEIHFSLIEGRELDPVNTWIHRYKHLFGKKVEAGVPSTKDVKGKGKAIPQDLPSTGPADDDEDSEDEEFVPEDEDSEPGEEYDSSHDSEGEDGEGGAEDEAEDSDEDEEGEEGGEGEDEEMEERHPLRIAGAVPRMSKAAMNMVVGIVEDEFAGGSGKAKESYRSRGSEKDEESENDELEEED